MLYSPGTKRLCAQPVPEEALLKLQLLGLRMAWDGRRGGWEILYHHAPHQSSLAFWTSRDIDRDGWDRVLEILADAVMKSRRPVGWAPTEHVESIEIPAAAVIDEVNFDV